MTEGPSGKIALPESAAKAHPFRVSVMAYVSI